MLHFWIQNVRQAFADTWGFLEGDYFMTAALIFLVCLLLVRIVRGRDSAKEWLGDGVIAAVGTFIAGIIVFFFCLFLVSPAQLYDAERTAKGEQHANYTNEIAISENLRKKLQDKSPKLNGFVNRYMLTDEAGTSNSLIFIEVTIGNDGGSPTAVTDYALRVDLATNRSKYAEEIYFTNDYKNNFVWNGRQYFIDLKRPELISERTVREVPAGGIRRGWLAYKLIGTPMSGYNPTNIILSFSDCDNKKTFVTNGIWNGKLATNEMGRSAAMAMILPGSDNIFYPVTAATHINTSTNWLPPELPNDCSNVTVFFGSKGTRYTRLVAEISPEKNKSTEFSIRDLPEFLLSGLNKTPGYSPRLKNIWYRWSIARAYGDTKVTLPVMPFVISNRLYADVNVPFLDERKQVFMSDQFDSALEKIPNDWDWNYSTNYGTNAGFFICELVNEMTNPVLQVEYLAPNTVLVNGIFIVATNKVLEAFNRPPQLITLNGLKIIDRENMHEVTNISKYLGTNTIGDFLTNAMYDLRFPGQRPIFRYPSNRHLGSFQKWFLEANKSVTTTLDKGQ